MNSIRELLDLIPEWTEEAACEGKWELFDADIGDRRGRRNWLELLQERAAKEICMLDCPVRQECLYDALRNNVEYTIRGGYNPIERKKILSDSSVDWSKL